MAGWTKLEHSIIQSSIWDAPNHIRIVWITMLALQDKNGYVGTSTPGLAHSARVTVKETQEALEVLSSPDEHSRDPENDGCRIEKADRGWKILNSEKFRGPDKEERRREQNRLAKQRQRERENGDTSDTESCHGPSPAVTDGQQCQQKLLTVSKVSSVSHNKNKNKNKKKREKLLKKDLPESCDSGPSGEFTLSPDPIPRKLSPGNTVPSLGSRVWKSYVLGYEDHYGVKPKSNAKNYKHCDELVKRLGIDEALAIAEWYPFYRNSYHVGRGHALGCLVADCETIYTAMVTGHQITSSRARTMDRQETTRSAVEQYLRERDGGIDGESQSENDSSDRNNL